MTGRPDPEVTRSTTAKPAGAPGRVLLGLCIVLTAFNLRCLFGSLSAVLPELLAGTGGASLEAAALTTGPVICLGLFAPVAPRLARRLGIERAILCLLLVLAAGTALRGVPSFPAILVGSLAGSAGIAAMNVLLPGLVKRDFPDRTALMTGLYVTTLCIGAALAAGSTVPLQGALAGSWAGALAIWALPALLAAALWLLRPPARPAPLRPALAGPPLWHDPLAWQVTAFMGSQSALAYCIFGWLAPILRERGLDAAGAGYVVSVTIMSQMAASLSSPWLATRGRDQRLVSVALVAVATGGFVAMLFAPLGSVWIWAVIAGFGQGGLLAVAMTIIILRSPDALVAARLSAMAQGIGYVLAASGPLLVGLVHGPGGALGPVALLIGAIGVVAALAALGAGRARLVRAA